MRHAPLSLLLLGIACAPAKGGGSACGITALAGATMLLDQFAVPQKTLSVPPSTAPQFLAVRLAAGPAYRGLVSTVDSSWAVTVEGEPPQGVIPGFGVLITSSDGVARGVMLYTGKKLQGAPVIGTVTMSALSLPLVGLQTDIAGLQDAQCPFFPDSLAKP